MASISTDQKGLHRILFAGRDGKRKRVRLGAVTMKAAENWLSKVEAIVSDLELGRAHDPDVCRWLAERDEKMLNRLRKAGLADGVGLRHTSLGAFMVDYFKSFTGKESTRTFYGHTRRNLESLFGETRPLRSIGAQDADAWRASLVDKERLSPATVARRVIAARTFWRKAVRWKLAAENPFEGLKSGHQNNPERTKFIPREIIDRAIAEAPDTEWKAIIALSRYAGLRCPSETFALKWQDVNWAGQGSIRVTCPKLAHIPKYASRTVPLFEELRPYLLALFEEAEPGTEYVITKHRLACKNLRQEFGRILARAGINPWPRLFHNLRASRETELMRDFDLVQACEWIGNSPAIAAAHYAAAIDRGAAWEKATGRKAKSCAESGAADGGTARKSSQPSETGTDAGTPESPNSLGNFTNPESNELSDEARELQLMGPGGLEPPTNRL